MAPDFRRPHRQAADKQRLLIIAATALALLIIVGVVLLLNFKAEPASAGSNTDGVPSGAIGTVMLLAPEQDIKIGARLSEVHFREVYWPRDKVPEGAVREASELTDQFAKVEIAANTPVQRFHLSPTDPTNEKLALSVGHRAVSIEVDDISSLEGHARPGSIVDVTLTSYKDNVLETNIIVQNARVLSYGGNTGAAMTLKGTKPQTSRTMTLDVSVQDALKIQTGRQLGRLNLLLKASGDEKGADTTRVNSLELLENRIKKPAATNCIKGKARVGGQEYLLGCDGSMNKVVNDQEP